MNTLEVGGRRCADELVGQLARGRVDRRGGNCLCPRRHSDWAVFRSTAASSYGLSYRDTDRHPYAATAHSNRRHSHTSQTADSYTLTHTHKNAIHNPYANSNLHAD